VGLQLHQVEFVGGPFDGHKRDSWAPPHEAKRFVSLPVNRRAVSSALDLRNRAHVRATSVAHYELLDRDGVPRYYFLGASRPSGQVQATFLCRLVDRLKRMGIALGGFGLP
jgi:hypothetical protein